MDDFKSPAYRGILVQPNNCHWDELKCLWLAFSKYYRPHFHNIVLLCVTCPLYFLLLSLFLSHTFGIKPLRIWEVRLICFAANWKENWIEYRLSGNAKMKNRPFRCLQTYICYIFSSLVMDVNWGIWPISVFSTDSKN